MNCPLSYSNWLKYEEVGSAHTIVEYPLYSDITVTSEIKDGLEPLSFHNAMPICRYKGEVVVPIVLRLGYCLDANISELTVSNFESYHGGWINDEIAALISLILGARFYAGDEIRSFGRYGDDPLGSPQFRNNNHPPLSHISSSRYVLPLIVESKSLNDIAIIKTYPKLSPNSATKLIQVARQYQNALLVAETDPSLTWVMLISALEVAANEWATKKRNNVERLKLSFPEHCEYLESLEIPNLLKRTADTFVDITRSTQKFIDFCLHFKPCNLEQPKSKGFDYTTENFTNAFKRIYTYRSKALHGGIPFPAPMCSPPDFIDNQYWQRPSGLASSTLGATWMRKDLPMNLHLFHHLSREILLAWWLDCAKGD